MTLFTSRRLFAGVDDENFGCAAALGVDPVSLPLDATNFMSVLTVAGSDADFDDLLAFTPVPMQRRRADGWSAERQRRFITALSVMGAVGPAARAVGMGRASAYRLRERAGAAGFAEAWDIAIACGADLQFHTALDQAINGVTKVRVMRGGTVEVVNAPDRKVLNAALLPKTRLSAALSAQARAVKATRETL